MAALSGFLAEHGANIVDAQQHTDTVEQMFFMRVVFDPTGMNTPRGQIEAAFRAVSDQFAMRVQLRFTDEPRSMAIMVSREEHCLIDL